MLLHLLVELLHSMQVVVLEAEQHQLLVVMAVEEIVMVLVLLAHLVLLIQVEVVELVEIQQALTVQQVVQVLLSSHTLAHKHLTVV